MARTTDELVAGIIEVDEDIDLEPFITVANLMVNRHCEGKTIPGTDDETPTEEELLVVETWLTAHFYAIDDPRRFREKVSSLSQTIESKVDLGLDVTRYGQQAKLIDATRGLANADAAAKKGRQRIKGRVVWLGTPTETPEL